MFFSRELNDQNKKVDGSVLNFEDSSQLTLDEIITDIVEKNLELAETFKTDEDEENMDQNQEEEWA